MQRSRPWRSTAAAVALLAALAAPAAAGVHGRSFTASVDFSRGGAGGTSGVLDTCIRFDVSGGGGCQDFSFGPEPITFTQFDLFFASVWSAISPGQTNWINGFELFGVLAIASVSDLSHGQGLFVGLAGPCSCSALAATGPDVRPPPAKPAPVRARVRARIDRSLLVPRMQPCRMP